jgi:hypothetical protein
MTRDDIIRMAREAGAYAPKYPIGPHDVQFSKASLERFAALVADAEREACAVLCEDLTLAHPGRADLTADQCAAAIRARGQA